MKAFVTGATGLLGSNLVKLLIKEGHSVKALVRSLDKAHKVFGNLKVEIIVGDILKVDEFSHHLSGCDILYHTAAYYREYSKSGNHNEALKKINIESTYSLIEASRKHGVNNIIFVSSSGVMGKSLDGLPENESTPYDEGTKNLYFKSKIDAEKMIDQYLKKHKDVHIAIVRPSMMIGAGDSGPTPTGEFIISYLNKKLPVVLPVNVVMVDACDVAESMIKIGTNIGSIDNGERYIIGGNKYTMLYLMETLEKVSRVPAPKKRPPFWFARLFVGLSEIICRLGGQPPHITSVYLKRMRYIQAPDSSKVQKKFGLKFRNIKDTLKDTVDWFITNGYVNN